MNEQEEEILIAQVGAVVAEKRDPSVYGVVCKIAVPSLRVEVLWFKWEPAVEAPFTFFALVGSLTLVASAAEAQKRVGERAFSLMSQSRNRADYLNLQYYHTAEYHALCRLLDPRFTKRGRP